MFEAKVSTVKTVSPASSQCRLPRRVRRYGTSHDVTMVDECKQSTTTSSTHVKNNLQVNIFHDGWKVWMDLYRHYVCPGSYLEYAFSIYKAKYDNRIGESPSRSWCYLICIINRGLCSYNARLFNEDVTAIGVSYWRRREFPKYARLHRRLICWWGEKTNRHNMAA